MTLRAAAPGTLSFGPSSASRARVPETVAELPPSLLRRLFGTEHLPELQNIFQERNPRLRAEAMFSLASRLEQSDLLPGAAELYHAVVAIPGAGEFSQLARQRLQVLQGRGPLVPRIESLGRHFVEAATDPVMIGAFGIAAGVAGLVRLSTGAWLASRGAGLLSRGLGARLSSGVFAYAAEVPSFVGARRLLSTAVQPQATATEANLGHELSSAAVFLGILQVTGFAGSVLGRSWRSQPLATGAWNAATGLTGVYLAQRAEEILGLRTCRDEASRWVDSADTWLQMRVGARLMHGLGDGGNFRPSFERLFRYSLETSLPIPGAPRPRILAPFAAAAIPTGYLLREITGATHNVSSDLQLVRLSSAWGPASSPDSLRAVRVIGMELGDLPRLVEMMERTGIRDRTRLEISLRRLRHMVEHARPLGARGNYLEWLTRMATSQALRTGDPVHLDRILDALYEGRDLNAYEKMLAPLFPQYQFKSMTMGALRRALQPLQASYRRIRQLPLGTPARDLLNQTQAHLKLLGSKDPLYVDMNLILESLESAIRERDDLLPDIERAMAPIPMSALPYLRMFRLHRILTRQFQVYPKLLELNGEGLRLIGFRERTRNPMTLEAVEGTQANGFYEEPRMAELFADFYRSMPGYLDPAASEQRGRRRRGILSQIWPERTPLTNPDVLAAFEALGDPISSSVAASLRNREVDLEFLEGPAFEAEVDRYISGQRSRSLVGVMVPAEERGGRNRILIRQIDHVSAPVFQDEVFHRLAYIVHEHEHHIHTDPKVPRSILEITRQEMLSSHREFQWKAENGDMSRVAIFSAEAATGWAMHLRSAVEGWNFRYPDPND